MLSAGEWEVLLPAPERFALELEMAGEPVETWQSRLGLQHPQYAGATEPSRAVVRAPAGCGGLDVAGEYALLDKCGGACGSLHKRVGPAPPPRAAGGGGGGAARAAPPRRRRSRRRRRARTPARPTRSTSSSTSSRVGPAAEDGFIFATTHERLRLNEARPGFLAALDPGWRPSGAPGDARTARCVTRGRWLARARGAAPALGARRARGAVVATHGGRAARRARRGRRLAVATSVLVARVPLGAGAAAAPPRRPAARRVGATCPCTRARARLRRSRGSRRGSRRRARRGRGRRRRARSRRRRRLDAGRVRRGAAARPRARRPRDAPPCAACAPDPPTIAWLKVGQKIEPREDPYEAGAFERKLKARPPPFVLQLRASDADGDGATLAAASA